MDVVEIARWQFGITTVYHFLMVPLTIGLGAMVAVMHTAWAFDSSGAPLAPEVGRSLIEGYRSAFPLSEAERRSLWVLAKGACLRFALTRAWDWLNTPADALVTRKNPLAYVRRLDWYDDHDNCTAAFA